MATLEQMNNGINGLFKHMTESYAEFLKAGGYYTPEKVEEYNHGLEYHYGKSFIKLIKEANGSASVVGFVVLQDSGKFKQGDLLRAAGWNAPAKNFARGNILTGDYGDTRWSGVA
jgi:hypothetical protein